MAGNEENNQSGEESETEFEPYFEPIINLPEVVISTNEENEIELLKIRAKLYRWAAEADPVEWKERGTGDIKFLRHTVNNNVRVVMRRDKTLKVCANHFIVPWLELLPKSGTENAFVYTVVADFADEQPKSETFAIKFGNAENAKVFKDKFEEAKKIVLTECSLYNGEDDKNLLKESSCTDESDDDNEDNEKSEVLTDVVTKELKELKVEDEKSQEKDQ